MRIREYIHIHVDTHTLSLYEHYMMWGRTYTLYENVMDWDDLPGRGSAKFRMVSGAALVLFEPSSVQMILLHDGSVSTPSPCSQHSITARRRLSSDWCCLCIPSNTPLGINLSPSVLQATPGRNFRTPSTVSVWAAKKERGGLGTDHMLSSIAHEWSVAFFQAFSSRAWQQG